MSTEPIAWMGIPDWRTARNAYKLADAMLKAKEHKLLIAARMAWSAYTSRRWAVVADITIIAVLAILGLVLVL